MHSSNKLKRGVSHQPGRPSPEFDSGFMYFISYFAESFFQGGSFPKMVSVHIHQFCFVINKYPQLD
jgi:hypothetical protein